VAIVTSLQIDSMAILDMAYQIDPSVRVITVDTGRVPEATLEFLDEVRAHYPEARWRVLLPDHREVEEMVERHGANLFYKSVPMRFLCCHIRKVRPPEPYKGKGIRYQGEYIRRKAGKAGKKVI